MTITEKSKEPRAPVTVLLGLIFVNFGPLKVFPKMYPPISEAIQTKSIINVNNFRWEELEKTINKKLKIKI